jgi:hypothetical protein
MGLSKYNMQKNRYKRPPVVKKLWSDNPEKYKYIPTSNAIEQYYDYIKMFTVQYKIDNPKHYPITGYPKTFRDWLNTEI